MSRDEQPTGVSAIAVTCNECGAALDVPAGARFVTCTYCGSRLEIHRSGGAAYTEVLDAIEENTERIAEDVGQIRLQNELEQLDREWMMRREQLMVTGRHGSRYVPGKVGALVGAAIAAVFGIFWTVAASSMGAPGFFPLFGVVFVVVAVAGGIYGFTKAGEYEQAERDYQSRRAALLRTRQGVG
jgi:hypothetical protein